jgi:hypothetical protein
MQEDIDFRFKNQLFVSDRSAINFYFHLSILINTCDDENRIRTLEEIIVIHIYY